MKHGFVVTSLVLVAGYSTVVAAETLGVLPSNLSNVPLPAVVAWSAAAGVLGMGWRDYAPSPRRDGPSKPKPAIEVAKRARSAAAPETGWIQRTVSA